MGGGTGGSVVFREVSLVFLFCLLRGVGFEEVKGRQLLIFGFYRMAELRDADEEAGIEDGIRLPSMEIARTFAVETIDFPSPLGLQ